MIRKTRQIRIAMHCIIIGFAVPAGGALAQTSVRVVPNTTGPSSILEGHGLTSGGAGGPVYRVSSLADSGPGTLRDGIMNRSGPRTIVFDVGGTITLLSDIRIRLPYLTIDGSTAPSPGITIRMSSLSEGEFMVQGTHDVILRHLRFHGPYQGGEVALESDILGIVGDAHHIVYDHLTLRGSTDGAPDFYGNISDVTVSWCLIYYNWHPTNSSYDPDPSQERRRISMHHNVYARNGERNPQFKAGTTQFDFVNNVIFDYAYYGWGYGTRIRNVIGETQSSGNIINNYYAPTKYHNMALVYGGSAGRDAEDGGPTGTFPQGTVVSGTQLGSLYTSGNILPVQNVDHYSTVGSPVAVPAAARVTTYAANQLKAQALPLAGMSYRTSEEQALLDDAARAMTGVTRIAADFDADGDVDLEDLERLAACSTRAKTPVLHPDCLPADLDGDLDVDQNDFGAAQRCVSGADGPVLDTGCLK